MSIIKTEQAGTLLGVPGNFSNVRVNLDTGIITRQTWTSEQRETGGRTTKGDPFWIQCEIRFDDQCGNGHETFSITGTMLNGSGGCIHEEIAKHFPELAPLIKWHLTSTDGPMHYVANTVYLASDRDHNGLKAGEKRQIRNGRTGNPSWELAALVDGEERRARVDGVPDHVDSETQPEPPAPGLYYAPWCRVGEGKTPDIEAARRVALWPDATPEQLQDREALKARLPGLLAEFRQAIEGAGLIWPKA